MDDETGSRGQPLHGYPAHQSASGPAPAAPPPLAHTARDQPDEQVDRGCGRHLESDHAGVLVRGIVLGRRRLRLIDPQRCSLRLEYTKEKLLTRLPQHRLHGSDDLHVRSRHHSPSHRPGGDLLESVPHHHSSTIQNRDSTKHPIGLLPVHGGQVEDGARIFIGWDMLQHRGTALDVVRHAPDAENSSSEASRRGCSREASATAPLTRPVRCTSVVS